jgi:plasmid stabilization system protein ParE
MEYPLIVGPEAEAELTMARDWYEERRAGLGREFLHAVGDAFDRIQQNPLGYAPTYKHVRQLLIRRFPYVVCYTFDGNSINVMAVLHGHRDPNEWERRLQ